MIRVAITTDRFEAVAPAYADVGLEPVAAPCIAVEAAPEEVLEQARDAVSAAGLVVLTSARTVGLLWPEGRIPPVDVAAVGEPTAKAVEAGGGRVVSVGSGGLADLVGDIAGRVAGQNVVFPRAAGSDPAARHRLAGLAGSLREFEVYRTMPLAPPPVETEAVAFASPSAVTGWHRSRRLTGLIVGAIGRTTETAVTRWRTPDVVAASPSHPALAAALASHLEVIT